MRTTTEAVIELLGRADGEAGGFFVMKGAQAAEIGAAFPELHVATDHVDDINAIEQILNEALRDHLATKNLDESLIYLLRAAFTIDETAVMSARPASLGLSTPMTLPMSCGPAAPTAAIAAATSACTSASDSAAGM